MLKTSIKKQKKMKIAICFFGQIRSLEENIKSLEKNIFKKLPNTPDIFCYFKKEKPNWKTIEKLKKLGNHVQIKLEEDIIHETKNLDKNMCETQKKSGINSILNQWYSIKMCNKLKKEYEIKKKFKYDWVILIRPDLHYVKGIEKLNKLNNNFIFFPKHDNYDGLNDRFCFSSSSNIDKRMNIFEYFKEFNKNYNPNRKKLKKNKGKWIAETVLYYLIIENNLKVKRTKVIALINRGNKKLVQSKKYILIIDKIMDRTSNYLRKNNSRLFILFKKIEKGGISHLINKKRVY
jgi:hypothetical protein